MRPGGLKCHAIAMFSSYKYSDGGKKMYMAFSPIITPCNCDIPKLPSGLTRLASQWLTEAAMCSSSLMMQNCSDTVSGYQGYAGRPGQVS